MSSAIAKKIISEREAVSLARTMQKKGKKLVAVGGSFDLLHAGHASLLSRTRRMGDSLMVLLNSDKSIRRYKGPHRPVIPQKERALMLASLSSVDYVVLFDDMNQKRILAAVKPPIVCKASDWGKDCIERSTVEGYGGKLVEIPLFGTRSTSGIIRSLKRAEVEDRGAIFLDRDGVINDNKEGYIHTKEEFKLLPGVLPALRRLSQSGYKMIIVSNQSGIGRGMYSRKAVERLHTWLRSMLRKKGIRIDAIYICPHTPDKGCDCRKPGIALFEKAARDFGLSLVKSWLVGDRESDVCAGREANIKTIKIGKRMNRKIKLEPHYYAKDLSGASAIILKGARK